MHHLICSRLRVISIHSAFIQPQYNLSMDLMTSGMNSKNAMHTSTQLHIYNKDKTIYFLLFKSDFCSNDGCQMVCPGDQMTGELDCDENTCCLR